jgi:hypothetical protein
MPVRCILTINLKRQSTHPIGVRLRLTLGCIVQQQTSINGSASEMLPRYFTVWHLTALGSRHGRRSDIII